MHVSWWADMAVGAKATRRTHALVPTLSLPGPDLLNRPGKALLFSLWGQHLLCERSYLDPRYWDRSCASLWLQIYVYAITAFAKVASTSVPAVARASLSYLITELHFLSVSNVQVNFFYLFCMNFTSLQFQMCRANCFLGMCIQSFP